MIQICNQKYSHLQNTSPAKSISNHICLSRVILNCKVVIFYQLKPSALPQIQLLLRENIFEALMISIDVISLKIEVMPPRL
jgi:hypothetical protein